MNDPAVETITCAIRQVQRRCQHNRRLRHLTVSSLVGLTVIGSTLMLDHWMWLPILPVISLIAILSLVLPLLTARPEPSEVIAQQIDLQLQLKARTSSAFQYLAATDDTAIAQRKDTTNYLTNPLVAFPYLVPRSTLLLALPTLLITATFFLPYQYQPPSETPAIRVAIDRLSQINDPVLKDNIASAIKKLSHPRISTEKAEKVLGELQRQVHQRQETVTDRQSPVVQKLEDALNQLEELKPEQMAELKNLVQDILGQQPASLPEGLSKSMEKSDQMDSKQLQQIIDALRKMNQAEKLKAQKSLVAIQQQIRQSRRGIAMAGARSSWGGEGLANSSGTTGQSGNKTRGSKETAGVSDWQPNPNSTSGTGGEAEANVSRPQTEIQPPKFETGSDLVLQNLTTESDNSDDTYDSAASQFSEVYVGETDAQLSRSTSFAESYQQAQKQYAEALAQNQIPVRYRQQIYDYLMALTDQADVSTHTSTAELSRPTAPDQSSIP